MPGHTFEDIGLSRAENLGDCNGALRTGLHPKRWAKRGMVFGLSRIHPVEEGESLRCLDVRTEMPERLTGAVAKIGVVPSLPIQPHAAPMGTSED